MPRLDPTIARQTALECLSVSIPLLTVAGFSSALIERLILLKHEASIEAHRADDDQIIERRRFAFAS